MITISLCMIVKNEERVLARCLDSAQGVAEEIIILDTGSADRTKAVAQQFTDRVYDFTWTEDFSAARNASFAKARLAYQMWLDADDILLPGDREKILDLKTCLPPDTDVVTMKYNTHFDEEGTPVLTSTRGRLFRRAAGFVWEDPVHEYIAFRGKVFHAADIFVTHQKERPSGDRNLKIYEKMKAEGKPFSPRGTYYFARELRDHGRYGEAAGEFERFLRTGEGWVEDNIAACFHLGVCHLQLGDPGRAVEWLTRSFRYDAPRAEICCQLGYCCQARQDYTQARDWFLLATRLAKPNTLGFLLHDYWGYIPHIELAVCYSRLGCRAEAIFHNERAAQYKPNAKAVQHNREYFAATAEEER